ncbi:MAG: hypothetical protein HQ518_03095 [Rhodopirellula sp.]|nr:hypothetical protein [Rhodopirellula sp.]
MGLFDIFSRGLSGKTLSGKEPRCDHYSFAHVVLRKAVFENPAHCVTSLASPDGRHYQSELWDNVVAACHEHHQPVELTLDDILIHKLRVGSFPCIIVEMPAPHFATEAFFVAIILKVDVTARSQNLSKEAVRYLTLENGEPHEEKVHTILGEWSADGRHNNLGPGTYPELGEFVACITDLVSQQSLPDESRS